MPLVPLFVPPPTVAVTARTAVGGVALGSVKKVVRLSGPISTDDFNRADGALGSLWDDGSPGLLIDANEMVSFISGSASYHKQLGCTFMEVKYLSGTDPYLVLGIPDGTAGVNFPDDAYTVLVQTGSNFVYLSNFVAGVEIEFSIFAFTVVTGDVLRVEIAGNLLSFYRNSSLIGSRTVTVTQPGTRAGIYAGSNSVRLNDFVAGSAGTSPTNTRLGVTLRAVAATITSAAAHVGGFGIAPRVIARKAAPVLVRNVAEVAGLATAKKVLPSTGALVGESTGMVTSKKITVGTVAQRLGSGASVLANKVARPITSGTLGSSGIAALQKRSTVSAVQGAGATGVAAATKRVVASVQQRFGVTPTGTTTHVGRVFAAAETLASGLHQIVVKKVSTPTVNGATGNTSVSSLKKVARPISAGTIGGVGSTLAQKKLPGVVIQAFGFTARGMTSGGSFIQARLALGISSVNSLVTKKTVATGSVTTGAAESGTAKKIVGLTGTGVIGASPFTVARKAAPALGRAVAGLAPNVVTTHVGRVFAAAETLASGLHQVLVKKVSTPTVSGALGGTSSSAATKKSVVVARQIAGLAPNVVTTHVGRVFAAAETLASGLHSVVARKVQGVSARGSAGVTSTYFLSAVRTVVARGFFAVAPSGLAKRINPVTGNAAVGESPVVAGKKVSRATAVGSTGQSTSVNAFKRAVTALQALVGQAQSLSAKKAATPNASLSAGLVQRVNMMKRSTTSAVQALGAAPLIGTITKKSLSSALGALGAGLGAVAQKKTTVVGRSTHGVTLRVLTGVVISARQAMGIVVTAIAKKVVTPSVSGTTATAPRVTAAKTSIVSATGSTGTLSRVSALKRTLSTPSLVFGAVSSALTRRKSAVNALGSIGSSSSTAARKLVSVSGRSNTGVSGTAEAVSVRIASAVGAIGGYLKALVFAFIGQPPHIENGEVVVTNAETQVLVMGGLADVVYLGGIADVIVNEDAPEAELMVDLGSLIIGG